MNKINFSEKQYREFILLRKEYDFSNSIKNPYVQKEKKQISINIEIVGIKSKLKPLTLFKNTTKN